MDVSLITGPGSHIFSLVEALKSSVGKLEVYYNWPKYAKHTWKDGHCVQTGNRFHDIANRFVTRVWNNVPGMNQRPIHIDLLYPLFDHLIARQLERADILWGWSQMSKKAIDTFRTRYGTKTILEYPMVFPTFWNKTILEEKNKFAPKNPYFYSLYTDRMVDRMQQEIDAVSVVNTLSTFAQRTFLDAGVPKEKLLITQLGVDTEFYYPEQVEREKKFTFLYVGRLELWKGLPYLFEAFSQLKSRHVELWCVGKVLPEFKDVLKKYEGDNRIKLLGVTGHEQLRRLYNKADCMVLPTLQDSFGMVILESMACGCPVVATTHSAGPDIITPYRDGLVIPAADVGALQQVMEWTLDNREEMQNMRKAARSKVQEHFGLSNYKEAITRLINGIK